MLLYVRAMISRSQTTTEQFFRMCHQYFFGTTPDLSFDVVQFDVYGVVPKYVQEYVRVLQQK